MRKAPLHLEKGELNLHPAERVGPLPTVSKYVKRSFRIRNVVGVSRKSVPTKVGTLLNCGVCIL
jgi:hypothetical protein